ncbi:MAG: V-type ATP synthase subunit F [Myxococcota bacterium]
MTAGTLMVVTRPGDGLGFRLAGVGVEEVTEGAEAERLAPLFRREDVGVIAIDERVLGRVPEVLLAQVERRGRPVLFPFTLPHRLAEPGRAESYVGALVRRAIGYHVRLSR